MIADDVQVILKEKGISSVVGQYPSQPNNIVAIIEIDPGTNIDYFGMKSDSMLTPLVRICIRNQDYKQAQLITETIQKTLHKYVRDSQFGILMIGSPIYLGRNSASLHEIQATFKVQYF